MFELLQLIQGSPEWLDHRQKYRNASDTPAVTGSSKYKSRAAFMKERATGIVPEVDAATQRRFDDGHHFEALARPLMEKIIGEDLFPVVGVNGQWSASFDGLTMMGDVNAEHKTLNDAIRACNSADELPSMYREQMEHQMMVSGAEKSLFMATKWKMNDAGEYELEEEKHFWYLPNSTLRSLIVAAWDQFEKDLANYEFPEEKQVLVADVVKDLPAVMVQVYGSVSIVDNFALFEVALRDFIDNKLVRSPQTDQDFVDLDEQIKSLKKAEDALDAAEVQMIAQVASVDSMKRTKDMLHKLARDNRLMAEKLLKAEKENRKAELVAKTKEAFGRHLVTLIERSGEGMAHMITPNFAGEITKLKSLDSMRDKLSVALANAKVDANAMADRVDANRRTVEDMTLFPDFAQVCTKAPDDFAALLAMRTAARKEAEEKRLAEDRERIRAEEQAKAQREAAEVLRKQQEVEAARIDEQRPLAKPDAPPVVSVIEPANDGGQMMKLGEINAALGITVTADFLDRLGIKATIEKNAKLFPAAKFPTICRLIADHILAQAFKKAA